MSAAVNRLHPVVAGVFALPGCRTASVTLDAGNGVALASVANLRIGQRGRGRQAVARGIGGLGRFFLNILPN